MGENMGWGEGGEVSVNVWEKPIQFIFSQNVLWVCLPDHARQGLPSGPVVKSLCFQCRGHSSTPGGGN